MQKISRVPDKLVQRLAVMAEIDGQVVQLRYRITRPRVIQAEPSRMRRVENMLTRSLFRLLPSLSLASSCCSRNSQVESRERGRAIIGCEAMKVLRASLTFQLGFCLSHQSKHMNPVYKSKPLSGGPCVDHERDQDNSSISRAPDASWHRYFSHTTSFSIFLV